MKGVSELMQLEPVEYGGRHTGALYRREQVEALMTLAARRACAQTVEWIAAAVEDCAGEDQTAVRTLAGLVRGEYADMLARLDLAAEPDPRLTEVA